MRRIAWGRPILPKGNGLFNDGVQCVAECCVHVVDVETIEKNAIPVETYEN